MRREHKFVEKVVTTIIAYNHKEYLIDINELITLNQYGDEISLLLMNLYVELSDNLNTGRYDKNKLKTFIYKILTYNNGYECCKSLLCEDENR
jgi:hypothetical protein